MKSDILKLKNDGSVSVEILNEVENCSNYCRLDKKQTLQMRLLSEELLGMLPELLENCEGEFWFERNKQCCELHVLAGISGTDLDARERVLSISSTGKNAAATGIMGKVRAAAEHLMAYILYPDVPAAITTGDLYFSETSLHTYAWSLSNYITQVQQEERKDAWDELEKSIVAKLADDVTVSIHGDRVEIIVKKTFA